MSQVPGRDPVLVEVINKNMQVPERLSVGLGQQWLQEEGEEAKRRPEEPPPAYSMQVPERLTYTEAPDMSPRPLFTSFKQTAGGILGPEPFWQSPSGEIFYREGPQSPIRRSHSDQSFTRTPPSTPTLKHALAVPRHPSNSTMENWSPEEDREGGAAVEFIILRRQVMKMSRRLASLERHNFERRNTEVVLFSLLFSACLLNVWLWIRR